MTATDAADLTRAVWPWIALLALAGVAFLSYGVGRVSERRRWVDRPRHSSTPRHVTVVEPHPVPACWAYTDSRGEVTDGR